MARAVLASLGFAWNDLGNRPSRLHGSIVRFRKARLLIEPLLQVAPEGPGRQMRFGEGSTS